MGPLLAVSPGLGVEAIESLGGGGVAVDGAGVGAVLCGAVEAGGGDEDDGTEGSSAFLHAVTESAQAAARQSTFSALRVAEFPSFGI